MLTSFGVRTITLRTVFPSSARCTLRSAIAAASRSASEMFGLTSSFARSLPWTWTIAVTESSTSSAGSTVGQPAAGVDRLAGHVHQLHDPGHHDVEPLCVQQLLDLVQGPVRDLPQCHVP